jgi:transposase-like protein
MAQRKTYDADDRRAALRVLALCGGNCAQASRETGVNRKTLARWAEEATPDELDQARTVPQSVGQRLDRIIDAYLRRLEREGKTLSVSQLPVAVGILIDKARQLRQEPPSKPRQDEHIASDVETIEAELRRLASEYGSTDE